MRLLKVIYLILSICLVLAIPIMGQETSENIASLKKLAEQGNRDAQFGLAYMYYNGQGVPQDYSEAAKWFRKAADQGNVDAQFRLGFMYYYGQGVPKDYIQAHMWFNLCAAISKGEVREEAVNNRGAVTIKMTSEQIATAEKLAKEWMEKSKKQGPQ